MKNILVPVSPNENAINTLQYAIDFASYLDANIFLVNIFSSTKISGSFVKIDDIFERESKNFLGDLLESVDRKEVPIREVSFKSYDTFDSINDFCNQNAIDLIITSTKNDASSKNIFLGKVTGKMVKDLLTPVLIIPSSASFRPVKKVLLAIKRGKIKSKRTLDILLNIKNNFDSEINLIQVKTPKMEESKLKLNSSLKAMINKATLTENATVFQGVLEFLHEENPDMICVIRRKRGFFKKLWEDDKVKKIDFESKIPLLVLKGKP
jgi:nucleotide-binding universal stress UspA family protein